MKLLETSKANDDDKFTIQVSRRDLSILYAALWNVAAGDLEEQMFSNVKQRTVSGSSDIDRLINDITVINNEI